MSARPTPTTKEIPSAPERNAYIDALRGWSILGVVCVHFAGSFVTTDIHAWSPSFYLGLALNQLFSFAVPLFVFLSGALAGTSRSTSGLVEYYHGRYRRIVRPYLLASLASFFLLNHYVEWQSLPAVGAKLSWLMLRISFYGVEPTLYFIPLIIQLYILQPALKSLPSWLQRIFPSIDIRGWAVILAVAFLGLHVTLGLLCNRGTLNYYIWGRPNVLFWMFYFFVGLHYRSILGLLSRRIVGLLAGMSLLGAIGAMGWNVRHLLDRSVMGAHFEYNRLDFAYARPEMLVYDLWVVLGLASGVVLGWSSRANLITYLGRYTLEIYLWHILVLYYGAWRYGEATGACREIPELIVLICVSAALLIAGLTDLYDRAIAYLRGHRIQIVQAG